MTELNDGTIVTDLDAHDDNLFLSQRAGYSIRHIVETWHEYDNHTVHPLGTRHSSAKQTCPYFGA